MSLPQDYTVSALTGKPGVNGTAAKFVEIEAPSGLVFKNGSPRSLTLNAIAIGYDTPSYLWKKKNGNSWDNIGTTQSITVSDAGIYKVVCGTSEDIATVISVSDGTSPYACSLSNENFSIATGTDLKPLSSGNYDCVFTAYKGSTQLTAVASNPGAGQFSISQPSGLTKQSDNKTLRFVANTATAISANAGYTVTINYEGTQSETKTITISAAKQGDTGEDGKNAIVMTSATTPSGEYEGQVGIWQNQIYFWTNGQWVCQSADLPTDAVLHYSFDDVPDLPDGTFIYKKDYNWVSSTWGSDNNNTTFSIENGIAKWVTTNASNCQLSNTFSTLAGMIFKIKCRASIANVRYSFIGMEGSTFKTFIRGVLSEGWNEISALIPSTYGTRLVLQFQTSNSGVSIEIAQIYIGDGSYNTPIIDNTGNGINATNNGAIAAQGVSGKGAYFLNGKYAQTLENALDTSKDFSVSLWINPDNATTSLAGYLIRKNNAFHLLNGEVTWATNLLFLVMWGSDNTQIGIGLGSLLPANQWTLLTITKSGNKLISYRNGVKSTEYTFSISTLRTNQNNINICYSSNTRPQTFDDILIFDRALSEQEVQALYLNKANTPKYYDLSDYQIEGIDDDGVISPTEKQMLYQKWIDIYAVLNGTTITKNSTGYGGEYQKMLLRATTAGVSLEVGEGLAFINATEALRAGLWTTANLQNMSVVTKTSAGAIDTLFNNYRTAYESLSVAIDVQNKATASALSISQSNSYHQIPTDAGGGALSYVGTDDVIYLLEGESKLTCVATGATLTAGQWKITNIEYTNCTSATTKNNYTISDKGAVIGVLTGITADSAKRTFSIEFYGNNASHSETISVVQSFAKAKAGADGSSYKLIASSYCVKSGTEVTFNAQKITGDDVGNFQGYLYKNEGESWSKVGQFKSGSAYASITQTLSTDTDYRLCKTDVATNFVDEMSVKIFRDGQDGHSPTVSATTTGGTTTISVDSEPIATINETISSSISGDNFSVTVGTDMKPTDTSAHTVTVSARRGTTVLSAVNSGTPTANQFNLTAGTNSKFTTTVSGGTVSVTAKSTSVLSNKETITLTLTYSDNSTETKLITITPSIKGQAGEDNKTISVILSAPNVSVPANADGSSPTFSSTSTTVRVYQNSTELAYDGTGTSSGTWKMTVNASGCTGTSITDSGTYATLANITAMANDSATRTMTITGKRSDGTAFTTTVTQTLSKNKKGNTGAPVNENLLHDSKLLGSVYGSTYPYYKYIDNGTHTANAYNGFTQTYCNNSSSSSTKDFLAWQNIKGFTLGDKYTLSFWAKGSGKLYVYWYGSSGYVATKRIASSDGQAASSAFSDGNTSFTLTSEWKEYWVTWQLNTTGDNTVNKIILFRANASSQVYIAGAKFEKGETATAWVPHADEYKGDKGDRGFSSRTIAFRVNYSAFSTANDGEVYVCGYNADGAEADTYGYVIINGTTYYAKGQLNSNCAMNGYMAIQKSGATSSGSPARPVYVFEDGSNTWYSISNDLSTPVKSAISSKSDWIVLAKVHSQTAEGKISLEPMTPCLLSDINSVIEMKYEGIVAEVTDYTAQITTYKITGNNGSFTKSETTPATRYVERGALVLNTNAVTPTSSTAQARMMLFDGTTWTEINSNDARYNDAILLCAGALPSLAGYYYTLGLATPNICGTYIDTLTTNRAFINEAMINLIRAYDINFKNSVSSYKDSEEEYVAGDLAISMGKNPKNTSDVDNNFLIQSYKTTVVNTSITTMTSATTPSGTYNGQLGRYQGQLYKWNGTTWVSVDSASIELWKKEFSTKKDNTNINLFVKGNLDITGELTTSSPDFFVGADIQELGVSGDEIRQTNGQICVVHYNGYLYNFCQSYSDRTKITVTKAVYSDNMTFSTVTTFSDLSELFDAILYKDFIYIATRNAIYKFNPADNTLSLFQSYCVYEFSIIDGLLNITQGTYNHVNFTFYDGTNVITKSSFSAGHQSLCHFTDEYYVACDEIAQGSMTRTEIYFYDKDFNYLGSKSVTGAPVTWLDGTQDTVGFTYPIYAFNGKLFTAGDTHYSTEPSVNRRTRLIYSENGGDSWKEAKDDSLYNVFAIGGFHFFNYNNCVIIQNTDSFYISYNGGSDFQYIDIDPEGFGNWNGSTPFVIDADKHYKDIIVPLSYGYGYLAIERIRQYNVAKPQPVRIRTSAPDNPVDGDIWID